MSLIPKKLLTPVFCKTHETDAPPKDVPVSYVLAGNGLFTHRRHRFFTSCVVSRDWPGELAEQKQYLRLNCPKLPQEEMERIVGFFSKIAKIHGSEAAVILYWDARTERVCFKVPEQRATMTETWSGGSFPADVHYETPLVDPELVLFGSVHSHVDGQAYSSHVDRADESHRTGLHIVVGRISEEPPEFHCEYVVDGVRFRVDTKAVVEGYERRRDTDIPDAWISRVKIEAKSYESHDFYYQDSYDRGRTRLRPS